MPVDIAAFTTAAMTPFSNTELTTWQDCHRRWFFGYFLGLRVPPEREKQTGTMQLGTRLHKALELHYGHGADPRAVLGVLYDSIESYDDTTSSEVDKEHTQALIMLDGYLDWVEETGVDYDLELVSTEMDVIVKAGISGIKFRGKLDQVVQRQSDGALLFHDWKTTGSFDQLVPTLHMNAQARFYALLNHLMAERDKQWPRVDGGLFTMLRRSKRTASAKPPFYRREEIRFNEHELNATLHKAVAIVHRIMSARQWLKQDLNDHHELVYPNPTRDCTWKCPFVRICPLMDDGSDWQGAALANYVQGDPYEYYDTGDNAKILSQLDARKGTGR